MRQSESKWRCIAAPIIGRVLEATRGMSERDIRRALRDAYPFGERRYYPYKIWLDEIRRQRERRTRKNLCTHCAGDCQCPGECDDCSCLYLERQRQAPLCERARQLFADAGRPIPAWLEQLEKEAKR